jgi:type IV pilus assembly protein PilF
MLKTLLAVFLLAMLAACASSPDMKEDERRKAAETNTALGRQYLDRGQYEIALDKLKRAVAYDREYAPAHTMLAVLYETIGETEDAEREFRLAVRYDPEDGDVNNNLGAFLCRQGKGREADPYFLAAIEDPFYSTPGVALANAGSCALADGQLDKAEAYLRQSLKYDQRMPEALLPLAEVSYRKEAYLQARAFLQRYEAVASENEESLRLGYLIETALGDQSAAERYRLELRENYPNALPRTGRGDQGQG